MVRRFTLPQMFVGVAVLALILAFVKAEGCSRTYTKIHTVAFSPDGKTVAVVKLNWRDANVPLKNYAADITRTISLVDVAKASPTKVIDRDFRAGNHGTATQFTRQGRGLAFGADCNSLFFLDFGGGNVRCCDLSSSQVSSFFDPGPEKEVRNFILSQNRIAIAVDIWRGGVSLLKIDDAEPIVKNSKIFIHSPFWPGLGWSADNRWVAILDVGQLRLFDATAKLRAGSTFPCTHAFAFGPRDDQLAVANGKSILLCDPTTTNTSKLSCNGEIQELKYIGEDKLVVTTGNDAMLLDIATGEATMQLVHNAWITALAPSPDGKVVAFGDNRGNLVLWDLTTGNSKTLQVPGKSSYPWTLPAAILVLFVAFHMYRRLGRANPHHPPLDA